MGAPDILPTPPTGTVALAFTDVQGSTKLWEHRPEAMRVALELHDRVMREAIARCGGYEVKTEGDAFMVAFSSAAEAVRFCLDAQEALVAVAWPDEILAEELASVETAPDGRVLRRGLRVRMGVHVGEPECRADPVTGRMDYFGPSVNRAARIGSAGHGGQLVVSERVWKAVAGDPDAIGRPVVAELGDHRLKDLESAERLFQLVPRRFGGRTFPPLRTLDARKTNLSPHPTPFVGRESDLGALHGFFERGERLVTLMGPGGTGKTRLSMRYAAVHMDAFTGDGGGGVWFVDLTEARGLDGICAAVGAALNVPLTTGKTANDTLEQLGRALASLGRVLLVLDNFEQVVVHAPASVGRWLAVAPESRFLVSSQERLRLPGEAPYELKPLPVPEAVGDPADSEAVQLFVQRTRAVRRDYELTAQEAPIVAEIVRELDGIPLAIELAAARMGVLSAAKLLERLPRRFDLLGGARRDATARQATLRGAIDWSWNLLQPYEQDALAQASVFHGGFDLAAAEEVLDLSAHPDAPWPLDVVQALRDKSLLRAWEPNETPGELRFGMYSNIREYAAERLAKSGNEAHLRERHAAWALRIGAELGEGPRLALELDNLVIVFRRATAVDPPTAKSAGEALEAIRVLDPVLSTRGPFGTHLGWLDLALQRSEHAGVPPVLRATVLDLRARARRLRGQTQDALADLAAAEAVFIAERDERSRALLLPERAWALQLLGQGAAARAALDEALALATRLGERRAEAEALKIFGNIEQEHGKPEAALGFYRRSVDLYRQLGNRRGEGGVLGNIGIVLRRLGTLDEARTTYEQALAIHREVGNRVFEGNVLGSLGGLLLEQGQLDDARTFYDKALAIHSQVGNQRSQGFFLGNRGILENLQGRYADSRTSVDAAARIFKDLGEARIEALYTAYRGAADAALGDATAATASFDHASSIFTEVGDTAHLGVVDVLRGLLDVAAGESANAVARIERAEKPGADGMSAAGRLEDVRFAIRILRRALAPPG